MSMTPIPVPPEAEAAQPQARKIRVGPPPGVSDEDCGTVEALYGEIDGSPAFSDFWRPTPDQVVALAAGGYLELRQYTNRMAMHSLTVHDPARIIDAIVEQDPDIVVAHVRALRDQFAAAADGLAASPQQQGSIYALQYVVEQLNAVLGAPETPAAAPEEPSSDG